MLKVKKHTLLLVAAIVWFAAGVNILRIGIESFVSAVTSGETKWLWLVILCALLVFTGFFFMFKAVVRKHKIRILGYEEKKSIFMFFDLKGYLLMAFMMGLGIALRHGNFLPTEFFASFYTGLGTALSVGGVNFLIGYIKNALQNKKNDI